MRTPRRRSAVAVAASLVLAQILPAWADTATATAEAQATPGDGAQSAPPGSPDLPSRVGRLARISGTVSFHTSDEDHWDPATLNYPVTSGDAFWTEPQAGASLEVAASRIDMAPTTEFDIDQLDDHTLTATQAQGETFLDLHGMQPNETVVVRTPRGTVTIGGDGQYGIVAGDTQTPTMVTVVAGAAQVSGDTLSLSVPAGQAATITGSGAAGDAFQGSVAAAQQDAFVTAELAAAKAGSPTATAEASVVAHAPARPATAEAHATATATVTAPAVVQQMSGGTDLSTYGDWQDSADYGRVWTPRVAADWVPYRDGHWAYVAPWGWTWIDDEAWGYAPFHYGRWLRLADRWAWAPVYGAPGYVLPAFYRPVYAPALVGFFGYGAGLAAGLAIGGAIGFGLGFGGFGFAHIGWCPLGWGEPFHPWFGGRGYFDRVNRFDVANFHALSYDRSVHDMRIGDFANAARGATVVPIGGMLASRRAASMAEHFSRADFAQAHPIASTPRPSAETAGVTPHLASRLGLPDAGAAAQAHAPGPGIGAAAHGAVGLRAPIAGAVARSPAAAAVQHAVGAAGLAAATHSGLPALRTAGAVPRATGGAPGPAFTPHGAPGPSLAHAGAASGGFSHAALPSLRSNTASAHAGASTPPLAHTQSGFHDQPATHGFSPLQTHGTTPHYTAPHYTASQTRAATAHVPAPQTQHFSTQHYQAPAFQHSQPMSRFQYSTPQYSHVGQAPQSHYGTTPQSHYGTTPQYPHVSAPAVRAPAVPAYHPAAPSGKRPWPP